MQLVTQAMLQRFSKAQPVNGAWAVLVDLGSGGFPSGETAFTEALDNLAQSSNDGVTFIVTSAATLIQPCVEADAGCGGCGAVWPAGDAGCGVMLAALRWRPRSVALPDLR